MGRINRTMSDRDRAKIKYDTLKDQIDKAKSELSNKEIQWKKLRYECECDIHCDIEDGHNKLNNIMREIRGHQVEIKSLTEQLDSLNNQYRFE